VGVGVGVGCGHGMCVSCVTTCVQSCEQIPRRADLPQLRSMSAQDLPRTHV